MSGFYDKIKYREIAEYLRPKVAVIVGVETPNDTQYSGKFGDCLLYTSDAADE